MKNVIEVHISSSFEAMVNGGPQRGRISVLADVEVNQALSQIVNSKGLIKLMNTLRNNTNNLVRLNVLLDNSVLHHVL